jgi:hypothetical protein
MNVPVTNTNSLIHRYRKCPDPHDEAAMKEYIAEIRMSLDQLLEEARRDDPYFPNFCLPPLPIVKK